MKGYKALNKDMTDKKGNTYEIGKEYHSNMLSFSPVNGFGFSKWIHEQYFEYDIDARLFEVEASGSIGGSEPWLYSNKIKLIRELSKKEITEHFELYLKQMLVDRNELVRITLAKHGYCLDTLVDDESNRVRCEVAKQGYGLNKLINDVQWQVRCEVATQGYGLDKLINDEVSAVRRAVARQGYGLDKLINDKEWLVRQGVAEYGYGLEKLVNDEDWMVRSAAREYITDKHMKGKSSMSIIAIRNNHLEPEIKDKEYGCVCPNCGTVFTFMEKDATRPRTPKYTKHDCMLACPNCKHILHMDDKSITEFTESFTRADFVTKYDE